MGACGPAPVGGRAKEDGWPSKHRTLEYLVFYKGGSLLPNSTNKAARIKWTCFLWLSEARRNVLKVKLMSLNWHPKLRRSQK